ncbi:TPA: hypothetical protein I7217_16915 [Vibrio vulnificus]|nr:hypothetical protein [Vibrio vulnificus]
MNLIKHHTLFVNGALTRFKHSNGDWSSFYSIDNIRLKNNNTGKDSSFISEQDKKLMKSLSEVGYSKKADRAKYESIRRRLANFYKNTQTEKTDWKHIIDTTGNILKIWLTNTNYDRHQKRIFGDIALFREAEKNQTELVLYTDSITTRFGKEDGRYHDFSKADGYKSFTHHLEMEKQEMRGGLRYLKENATKREIVEVVNHNTGITQEVIDENKRLREEIDRLKQKAA